MKLREEHELMHNETVSWDKWKLDVKDNLELFLREELQLTSDYYDADGNSVFHIRTRENVAALLADDSPQA